MWQLINQTPFSAERGFARDRDGAEFWLVAVRGTFSIQPDGSCQLAASQTPALRGPRYQGDPNASSLRYEADVLLRKRTTDVLLHGHAYAPGGVAVTELSVALRVGTLAKTLLVRGDRVWRAYPVELGPPEPFVKMPLVYERAFGGIDPEQRARDGRNPIGTGFALDAGALPGTRAPNIQYPGDSDARSMRPAGFGPIARHWSPRLEQAGTYDASWVERRQPLVPEDFDDRFYQAAPEDQQTPQFLRGGERVELTNLSAEGTLRFRLPRVPLTSVVTIGRRRNFHPLSLHTVAIEPDERRVILVWHLHVFCHHDIYALRETRVFLKTKLKLGTRQVDAVDRGPASAGLAAP